ncbi:MAG TPA: hypothetical protein VF644_07000 [Pyrinomonadaceae bacterium]
MAGAAARVCRDLRQLTHVATDASAASSRPPDGKRLWMEEKLFTA